MALVGLQRPTSLQQTASLNLQSKNEIYLLIKVPKFIKAREAARINIETLREKKPFQSVLQVERTRIC